jgi:hypothetical protein
VSKDSVVVSFTTDEPATVKINYGKSEKNLTQEVTTFNRSHTLLLSNLEPDKNYIYDVKVTDIGNNSDTSSEQTFKTEKDAEFVHPPLSAIIFSEKNPSILTNVAAVISFSTDQSAKCFVEYGNVPKVYDAIPVLETTYNTTHGIQLNGLLFLTEYFYKVTCKDNLGTTVSADEKGFKTQEQLYTIAGAGDLTDKTAPTISNIAIDVLSGESVTLNWQTDEKGSGLVRYGIASVDEYMTGDSLVNKSVENYATSHSVEIVGLVPATKYVFVAFSADAVGNISQSSESSFTTASPSSLSSIKAESKNLGEAVVTWDTSTETTSTVEYGLTTSYGEKKESSTQTKEHLINLSNLNQAVTYHFRVKGQDKGGKLYSSSDQTFEPKSPLQITNININDITEHEATVSFDTNVATNASVQYANVSDPTENGSGSSSELATKHSIILKNLSQGTTFKISIKASDEQGTLSELSASDVTTGKDENPPKIDMVRTDLALTQNDKVQSIISWSTDEQASSIIIYKEGRNGKETEHKISDNKVNMHISVLTIFKPGTVYNFKVKSVDASGNVAYSGDFALLTPRRKENIIQIIIGNFMDIFGWAKM